MSEVRTAVMLKTARSPPFSEEQPLAIFGI